MRSEFCLIGCDWTENIKTMTIEVIWVAEVQAQTNLSLRILLRLIMACSYAYCFDQLVRPLAYSHVHRDRHTPIEAGKAGGRSGDMRLRAASEQH